MASLFKKIAGLTLLGIPLLCHPAKSNAEYFFYLGMNANFGIGTPLSRINNIPEYIRTFSEFSHIDGYFPMKNNPINFSPIYGRLELKSGIGVRDFFLDFEIGPKVDLFFSANILGNINQDYAINYYGESKKISTYYNLNLSANNCQTILVSPGVSIKASFLKSLYAEGSANFGYEFYLEEGGDMDTLSLRKNTYKLADLINYKIKLGLDYPINYKNGTKIGFAIGTEIPQILNKTALADETKLEVYPNFFIELKLEFFDFQFSLEEQ